MRSVATHTRLTSGALRTIRRDSFFGELPATDRSRYAATLRVHRSAWNKFARATSLGILRSLLQHRRRSTGRNEMSLRAIKWENGRLEVLDQILLPAISRYVVVNGVEDGWKVINRMQVRGAPAIAIVGCLSLAVELRNEEFTDKSSLRREIEGKLNYLVSARPTAVNIKTAAEALIAVANMLSKDNSISVSQMNKTFLRVIDSMLEKDIADNKSIGNHGADEILKTAAEDGLMRVLTHCNTGSLATAGYGTALGVVRSLQERKRLEHVYCTETRPYNQGARLTAYELVHDKIPGTLICDDMVAALMKSRTISAVVVGADRVATNGDTANKIGTYQIAILAKYHGVPFYVAAPQTSIDFTLSSGDHIPIEERPDREMTHISDQRIAAAGIQCWNPAFDVTPASLITGIITEVGVFRPEELIKLQSTETTKKDMEELDNYIMRRKFRGSQD